MLKKKYASYLAKDIILLCSALSTFRLTPPDGNRVALVKYCNFASGLTGELPDAAAALTTLVTGSTSSLDFLTSKQKCRVPLHGSEIDKGKTMQESSLKSILKQFMKIISRKNYFRSGKSFREIIFTDFLLLIFMNLIYLRSFSCIRDESWIFRFPRNLEILGLDRANLSLTSISKTSEVKPTKVNCWN